MLVCRLESLKKNENKIFLQREWISIAIIFILVTIGNNSASTSILMIAAVYIAFTILRSNVSNAFYWSIFLIPNIRMLDGTGISFLVNALMALPIVVCFIRLGVRKLPKIAVIGSFFLFMMESMHDMLLCNLGNIVNIIAWSINLFLCIEISVDSRVKLSKNDVFSALSTGIIMSAAMFFIAGLETISHIIETMDSGTRFAAFADDPNYYSLYICLAIACILNVSGNELYKFSTMLLLVSIGLLTASKMCFILMIIEFIMIFTQVFSNNLENKKNKKFIFASIFGLIAVMIVAKEYVSIFVQNFIRRMGQNSNRGIDLESLTTGRSRIFMEYINILSTNWKCLLFGYGFSYHLFLGISTGHGAHNTYLDIILSWGLLGTILFIYVIVCWIRSYKRTRNIYMTSTINRIPLWILLINFFDLSCLSASMFPFVITIVIIQWLPHKKQ